jgi:hypothetical protein
MDLIQIAQKNIDAYNRHDIEAVNASYAEGATYTNPRAGQGLAGEAIGINTINLIRRLRVISI